MLFSSPYFVLGFLPAAVAGFFIVGRFGGNRLAMAWLVAASLFFYGWWNPKFVLLLIGSIGVNYPLGHHILHLAHAARQREARRWLIAGIAANLALLGWFKYANFLLHGLALVGMQPPELDIFLPLAISFFTFQQIMFLVESYRQELPSIGFLPYAGLIAFFPHLIAGPIVRPHEIIPQLLARDFCQPHTHAIADGLVVFLLGLAKKLVLADMFGSFADIGFNAAARGTPLTLVEAWYAAAAYALQIYFDFSAYSDMAIGLARMLNVRFPRNFASPYQASDITAFWRRWHITLSQFLRDYLYIPLGGSRCGEVRQWVNLMLTMLLGGLWHGAAWSFVLWGGLHGGYLTVHRLFRRSGLHLPAMAGRLLTLSAVIIAWVPFRASSLDATCVMLRGMAGLNGLALPLMIVHAFPPLGVIATAVPLLPNLGDARTLSFPEMTACLALGWGIVLLLPSVHDLSARAQSWLLAGGFALAVQSLFFAPAATPFLYFRF